MKESKTNKTIEELASAYQKRSETVHEKKDQIFKGEMGDGIEVPNYKNEVVIPILKMLREEMGGKKVKIPISESYALKGGLYRIKVGNGTVGGLSYPIKEDHGVYYTRLSHAKPIGERSEITSIKQLADIIREQLEERKKDKTAADDETEQ